MLFKHKPDYSLLKSFGCLALAYNPSVTTDKLAPRGVPCLFLGYPHNQKGYRLLNLTTQQIFTSRDVKFHEHIFPCNKHSKTQAYFQSQPVTIPTFTPSPALPVDTTFDDILYSQPENITADPHSPDPAITPPASPIQPAAGPILPRRSTRQTQVPGWLTNYIHQASKDPEPAPAANLVTATVSPEFYAFVTQLHQHHDPVTFKEAVQQDHWVTSMNEELSALESNQTWEITQLPPGK